MDWKNEKEKGTIISMNEYQFASLESTGKFRGLLLLLAHSRAAGLSPLVPLSLCSNVGRRRQCSENNGTISSHSRWNASLEMLKVKFYLEFNLAISVNVLIMHAFDSGTAFILQRNYMIYLPMCRKREVQRCSMLCVCDCGKQPKCPPIGK